MAQQLFPPRPVKQCGGLGDLLCVVMQCQWLPAIPSAHANNWEGDTKDIEINSILQ
jgi:hypothetical protein